MRKIFEEEVQRISQDIPVEILGYRELDIVWRRECRNRNGSYNGLLGTLVTHHSKAKYIFVYKHMPYYRKIGTLLHEYGHYLCYKKLCFCLSYFFKKERRTVEEKACQEFHAHRYVLKYIRKRNYKKTEEDYLKHISKIRKVAEYGDIFYSRICKKMVRAKLI